MQKLDNNIYPRDLRNLNKFQLNSLIESKKAPATIAPTPIN